MAECEHLARTSAYFDGELSPADEAAAASHLGGCAECQALLGDAVALDAALSGPRRTRSRWAIAAVGAVVAVAAGVALWVGLRPGDPAPQVAAIDLPHERALEGRFTGQRFAAHRPLGVLRGDRAREPIALAALVELEKRGELHDLAAALAASGDAARADEVAAKLPADAESEADRAAIALGAGNLELALRHGYRAIDLAPGLVAGHWNVALAARRLGLPRVARDELARVIAAGEPGWADEATRYTAALTSELAAADRAVEVDARGRAMAVGGPVLVAADVATAPAMARLYFFDAVRTATDRARLDALRPLASALDGTAGTHHATAMLDRADPALGARFGAAYRTLIERTATPEATTKLIDELRTAGRAADYLRAGAILLSGAQLRGRWQELRGIVAPWSDPWFDLVVERERILATWPSPDLRAEGPLAAALASCKPAFALRCGQVALELATLLADTGRDELAEERAREAVEHFQRAAAAPFLIRARSFIAELHRRVGAARARAEFEEIVLAAPESDCDVRRYARIGQAGLAVAGADREAARAALPSPDVPPGCTQTRDYIVLSVAVDLARLTGDPADRAMAERWLAAIGDLAEGGLALAARVGLAHGGDRALAGQLDHWVREHTGRTEVPIVMARAWGVAALISDAGVRADWSGAVAQLERDHPIAAQAPCSLVASVDVDTVTVAARANGALTGAQVRIAPRSLAATAIVPPAIVDALRACPEIAVIARPPLHARADLLPGELPWWFASDVPSAPAAPGARRALEVTDARPPDPALAPLVSAPSALGFDVTLTGAAATPQRVLGALADATYAELHVHGIAAASNADAAYLALSPDPDGVFALRADAVRARKLRRAPLVVLGACRAAALAPYLRERWSLPDALIAAGASGVVAVDVPIPDASARGVFDDLHRRIDAGEPVARAVAALRASPAAPWVRHLMVFR